MRQKNMTTPENAPAQGCPAESLLKMLAGKWKPQIFQLAVGGPVRFSSLLRQLDGANKQTLSVALKELERAGLLARRTIQLKPLHIEYVLTERGNSVIPVLRQLEGLAQGTIQQGKSI